MVASSHDNPGTDQFTTAEHDTSRPPASASLGQRGERFDIRSVISRASGAGGKGNGEAHTPRPQFPHAPQSTSRQLPQASLEQRLGQAFTVPSAHTSTASSNIASSTGARFSPIRAGSLLDRLNHGNNQRPSTPLHTETTATQSTQSAMQLPGSIVAQQQRVPWEAPLPVQDRIKYVSDRPSSPSHASNAQVPPPNTPGDMLFCVMLNKPMSKDIQRVPRLKEARELAAARYSWLRIYGYVKAM